MMRLSFDTKHEYIATYISYLYTLVVSYKLEYMHALHEKLNDKTNPINVIINFNYNLELGYLPSIIKSRKV